MMPAPEEVSYRLRLVLGFLEEARQDFNLERWRSCVDNSQLATENAAKAVLALLGPVGRTHNPSLLLREALAEGEFSSEFSPQVERLAECAELLGPDIHVQSDYGDEAGGRTPWELFDRDTARQALDLAEEVAELSQQLLTRS
ncbi:MAG: HEPN domain-containing protein [Syntrophales bacterium]|nr:HEPN domain-containing protein [Syntrophales bacterium]